MCMLCVTMQATYKYMQKAEFVHFNTEQIGQAKTFKWKHVKHILRCNPNWEIYVWGQKIIDLAIGK